MYVGETNLQVPSLSSRWARPGGVRMNRPNQEIDQKNLLSAVVLSVGVLVLWQYFFPPPVPVEDLNKTPPEVVQTSANPSVGTPATQTNQQAENTSTDTNRSNTPNQSNTQKQSNGLSMRVTERGDDAEEVIMFTGPTPEEALMYDTSPKSRL